jgi:hypothetical protein
MRMLSGMLVMILLGIAEACPHLILKSSLWSAHTTAAAGIQGYRSTVLANAAPQPRPEAAATQEHRLEGVGCRRLLGGVLGL